MNQKTNKAIRHSARLLALAAGFTLLPVHGQAQTNLYVSLSGNDKWSGTLKTANRARTDGPKRTLEGARNALRAIKTDQGANWKGAVVTVAPGNYWLTSSFSLLEVDSGTPTGPIVYKSALPKKAILDGGKVLTIWTSLPSAVSKYLKPEVRNKVLRCRLVQHKVLNTGSLSERGSSNPTTVTPSELFWEDQRMTLAQWPNNDWLSIAGTVGSSTTDFYAPPATKNWTFDSDIYAYGYFSFNWSDGFEKLASYNPTSGLTKLATPSHYGFKVGQRFVFANVFEELDQPGEYYIDRRSNTVYFYPPVRSIGRKAWISTLDGPLLVTNSARDVRFEGFVFQNGRRNAIEVLNGDNTVIAGSTIRNMGTNGALIYNGVNSGLDSCDIYNVAETGAILRGGDRNSLTPGRLFVRNSWIRNVAKMIRTYRPGVDIKGVGNFVQNNRIENVPHTAIVFSGNNHTIENNEIARACLETGDSSAVYTGGRDWTERGTVIRYNLFQDFTASQSHGEGPNEVYGVGVDDLGCGVRVEKNIFRRVDIAGGFGGGRDNIFINNVVDNPKMFGFSGDHRGLTDNVLATSWGLVGKLSAVNYQAAPYSTQYPTLPNVLANNPYAPIGSGFWSNVVISPDQEKLSRLGKPPVGGSSSITVAGNTVTLSPGFVNASANDFRLLPGSPLAETYFVPFSLTNLGLQVNSYRTTVEPLSGSKGRP